MGLHIKFKLLHPDAKPPTRAVIGDAGWDLSMRDWDVLTDGIMIKTGVAVEIPSGYFGLLRPRSSFYKKPFIMASSGIIDSGYRGEICMPVKELGDGSDVEVGDRVAQLIILPLPDVSFVQVDELSDSHRGQGGFGSTGK